MAIIAHTVKELKDILSTYPDDMQVNLFDGNEGEFYKDIYVYKDNVTDEFKDGDEIKQVSHDIVVLEAKGI